MATRMTRGREVSTQATTRCQEHISLRLHLIATQRLVGVSTVANSGGGCVCVCGVCVCIMYSGMDILGPCKMGHLNTEVDGTNGPELSIGMGLE